MDSNFTTMEVLLMTNTGFSKKEYTEKNEHQPSKNSDGYNKLAEACWNGMMPVILPELFYNADDKHTFMWQLEEFDHSLHMQLGQEAVTPDKNFTIQPWIILNEMNHN